MLQSQFPFLFTANASDKNMQLHGFTFSSVDFFAWLNSHTLVPFRCSLRKHEDMKPSILPILQTYFVCSSICLWCNWASSLPPTMFFNQVFFFFFWLSYFWVFSTELIILPRIFFLDTSSQALQKSFLFIIYVIYFTLWIQFFLSFQLVLEL